MRADEAVHRSVNHHFSDIPQFYAVQASPLQISKKGFQIEYNDYEEEVQRFIGDGEGKQTGRVIPEKTEEEPKNGDNV